MHPHSYVLRRVTLNLPMILLKEALAHSGKNITETVIEGLHYLKRAKAYDLGMKLKGKIRLEVDIEESRERCR